MMTILVCPLSSVPEVVVARRPERIVSILDPEYDTPDTGPEYVGRHLRLTFHDVHVPTGDAVVPGAEHVAELLVFLTQWERRGPILIHCRAGIGRSPAVAFIAACLHSPDADEHEIAAALRRAGPLSRPNETLVGLADAAMGRDGRMRDAISETGRGLPWLEIDEGESFAMPSAF